jgi:glutamate racemase
VRLGLERDPDLPPPTHRFLTTGDPEEFHRIGRRFLGPELQSANQFAWVGASS